MKIKHNSLNEKQASWLEEVLRQYDCIFVGIHGSVLYGLDHKGSDVDVKVLYVPAMEQLLLGEGNKTHSVTHKEVEIFEMCPTKKYNNYTPMHSFKGNNLLELKQNFQHYLEDLMECINLPLKECECCNGNGTIIEKREDK